jgi:hypothetical protein
VGQDLCFAKGLNNPKATHCSVGVADTPAFLVFERTFENSAFGLRQSNALSFKTCDTRLRKMGFVGVLK